MRITLFSVFLILSFHIFANEKHIFTETIRLAELGNPEAQYNLGVLYSAETGVEKNKLESEKWFRKAAEQGHIQSQLKLASQYEKDQNYEESLHWYLKAGEQGNIRAQLNLGDIYEKGRWVEQNRSEAIKWYSRAANQGDKFAKNHLERIKNEINELEFSISLLLIGVSITSFLIMLVIFIQRKNILDKARFILASAQSESSLIIIRGSSEHDRLVSKGKSDSDDLIERANKESYQILTEAKRNVKLAEERIARLELADKEMIKRLQLSREGIEEISDRCCALAADVDLVTDEDLLSSPEYQSDRKIIHNKLKSLSTDAFVGAEGWGSDVNITKFVSISAKADMAGALLLTTIEMLCAKVTPNSGHNALEKLYETILAAESLVKIVDSRAEINPVFKDALVERLRIEINFKKAKQIAKEEQRELREQEREERKVAQEALQLQLEAEKEEKIKHDAIVELEKKLLEKSEAERSVYEIQLNELRKELLLAHEKSERARSRAQETRSGHVYVISNIGSFGEGVLKIGMTRRLDPLDRVKELSDASVPFSFDIHAIIESDDAPTLEKELHKFFEDRRVNKVNHRKEYFRLTIDEIEKELLNKSINALINKVPSADEYYQTIRIETKSG